MVHKYQVSGMTCTSCEAKVKSALLGVNNVKSVEVSKEENTATLTMDRHISIADLQRGVPHKYKISAIDQTEVSEETKSWFKTYKPILLIFTYISAVTLFIQTSNHHFDFMQWMRHFMAGFFLTFSFFKMLNLKGFAESYLMYDVVARKIPAWAYIYPFLELGLGVAFLANFNPFVTSLITLIIMALSIIGVLKSVLNKTKIQCACLGTVFNLPMSTITIIEDGLMIVMSLAMLIM